MARRVSDFLISLAEKLSRVGVLLLLVVLKYIYKYPIQRRLSLINQMTRQLSSSAGTAANTMKFCLHGCKPLIVQGMQVSHYILQSAVVLKSGML